MAIKYNPVMVSQLSIHPKGLEKVVKISLRQLFKMKK